MKLRTMVRTASFLWGAYGMYRRTRSVARTRVKTTLRRAARSI